MTPNLRGEGYTEQTGDITLTCTGGVSARRLDSAIPQVNITVFYNTAVTSRLLPTSASSAISEALLLIDEPGSGLPRSGSGLWSGGSADPLRDADRRAAWKFANSTLSGRIPCDRFHWLADCDARASARLPAPNVFQGVVTGNSVTFFGIPVLAPGTTSSRVLPHHERSRECESVGRRLRFGRLPGSGFDLDQRRDFAVDFECDPVVGFVTNGLTASVSGSSTQNQCSTPDEDLDHHTTVR